MRPKALTEKDINRAQKTTNECTKKEVTKIIHKNKENAHLS